jgi:8-amino-7-oxononanoate synthase
LIDSEPSRRDGLLAAAGELRTRLSDSGFNVPQGSTPIIPVLIGDAGHAAHISALLLENDILLPAIRPPTVPPGGSRLRISLCASHTPEQIDTLIDHLRRFFNS